MKHLKQGMKMNSTRQKLTLSMENMKIWLLVSCMVLTNSTALCMKSKLKPLIGQQKNTRLLLGTVTALVAGGYAGKKLFFESNSKVKISNLNPLLQSISLLFAEEHDPISSPLYLAVENDNLVLVKFLIENGANVNSEVGEKNPLYLAAERNNLEIIKFLIKNGANINVTSEDCSGESLLKLAVWHSNKKHGYPVWHSNEKHGNLELIKFLIENGANVNGKVGEESPLSLAVKNVNLELVNFLIENGAKIEDCSSASPVYFGVWDSDSLGPHNSNFINVKLRNLKLIRVLIKNGANVNGKVGEESPLSLAVRRESIPVVRLLIENGANVNSKFGEDTPLDLAVELVFKNCKKAATEVDITTVLLANDARVSEETKRKDSFRYLQFRALLAVELEFEKGKKAETAFSSTLAITTFLLANGARVSEKTKRKDSFRYLQFRAYMDGNLELVKLLIENGVNVNSKFYENTPLSLAVRSNNPELVRFLIENGADIDSKGNNKDLKQDAQKACQTLD